MSLRERSMEGKKGSEFEGIREGMKDERRDDLKERKMKGRGKKNVR